MPPEAAQALETPPTGAAPPIAAPKSFEDRWKAVGGEDLDAPEPVEAPPAEAKSKPAAAAPPDERAQLEALAKKLGFAIDGNGVTVAERADFRRAREKREKEWADREAKLLEREKSTPEDAEFARTGRAILDAIERGDPDAFAREVKAKDFNEFQQNMIRRLADPNYGELRKLQQWKDDQEKLRVQQEEQQRQNAENAKRAEAYKSYMATLSATCKASADPLVASMHDDPLFLQAVYNIQEQNWDKDLMRTCTAEEAIAKAARGAAKPLKDELQELYQRLHKAFGGATTEAKPNGKKPAPKTAVTPKATTADGGGAPKPVSEMTPAEWAEYKKKKFAEADD